MPSCSTHIYASEVGKRRDFCQRWKDLVLLDRPVWAKREAEGTVAARDHDGKRLPSFAKTRRACHRLARAVKTEARLAIDKA
jgi:hypothetical protein